MKEKTAGLKDKPVKAKTNDTGKPGEEREPAGMAKNQSSKTDTVEKFLSDDGFEKF